MRGGGTASRKTRLVERWFRSKYRQRVRMFLVVMILKVRRLISCFKMVDVGKNYNNLAALKMIAINYYNLKINHRKIIRNKIICNLFAMT